MILFKLILIYFENDSFLKFRWQFLPHFYFRSHSISSISMTSIFQFRFQWEHDICSRKNKYKHHRKINMIIIKVFNNIQCNINHYQFECSNGFTHGITNGLIILEMDYRRNYNGFTKETKNNTTK